VITLLSHNIFWLQGVPFLTDRPEGPRPDVLDALVRIYNRVEPDVICLQEVQSAEAFDRIQSALGLQGAYCPGAVHPQYGGATLWESGRLVTDGLVAHDPPHRIRQLVEVAIDGAPRLTVCHVHLPSNRQLGKEASALRRVEEIRAATASVPDVVVGDFNEFAGGKVSVFLTDSGYVDVAAARGMGDVPSSIGGRRGDQIWVRKDLEHRVAEYGVLRKEDLKTDLPGITHLSDHLPLWIRFGRVPLNG
jgi:endonuclease/exonuclease/phosphatase family metal-dependent hydrolase